MHHDIYMRNKSQHDALLYSQYISVINLYMLRAGLLLIIRRYFYTEKYLLMMSSKLAQNM